MAKYDVKVRYTFEGTYTVAADNREEAERMVTQDCGLVMGGNIHTTLDDEEVDWNFSTHPDMQVLSFKERGKKGKAKYTAMDFSGRIEELRKDIIEAIRQLLYAYNMKEITLSDEGCDPVWVIWFGKLGDPYECRVTGLEVTDNSLTVFAAEKESGDEVACYSPFELGAKNIDWLYEMYEAVRLELEEPNNVES